MAEVVGTAKDIFAGALRVMLSDGVLTREERRLTAALSRHMKLKDEDPLEIYEAVISGKEISGGKEITEEYGQEIYVRVYEVALVGVLSNDEWQLLGYLRDVFGIDEKTHREIEALLMKVVEEKYEPKMHQKMIGHLKDSVSIIGRWFDSARLKNVN